MPRPATSHIAAADLIPTSLLCKNKTNSCCSKVIMSGANGNVLDVKVRTWGLAYQSLQSAHSYRPFVITSESAELFLILSASPVV